VIGTTRFSPDPIQAKTIGSILDRWRLANGWQPLESSDQNLTIAAWFQVLKLQGVTVEFYDVCYRAAVTTRAQKRNAGENVPYTLSAEAVASEWPAIREKLDKENPAPLMLTENAAAACQRCFGTGNEEMFDGTSRSGCMHLPMTETERLQGFAMQAQFIKEASQKIGNPVAVVTPAKRKQPASHIRMQCSHCSRPANSLEGWQLYEACGRLIAPETFCPGVMRISDKAIYARF
jgi:hypothetical protein